MTKTLSITVSGEEIDVTVSEPSVVSRVYALIGTGGGGGGGAVDSVNGQTGVVVLGASDVGAVPTTRTVTAGMISAPITMRDGAVVIAAVVAPATRPLASIVRTGTAVAEPYVAAVTPLVARVGFGYVPVRSPPADPLGVRESERRESLPWHDVPEVVP